MTSAASSGFPQPRPISRLSTAEEVADVLREQILKGELVPGSRLTEVPMAAAFGVSRNTLREAFRLLGREGLIEHIPHRGGFVARLEVDDVHDLYRTRRILEIAGVRATTATSPAALARLRHQFTLLDDAARRMSWRDSVEHDIRFHACVAGLLESPRVDEFFVGITAQLRLGVAIMNVVDEKYSLPVPRIIEQHARILSAIEAQDVELAERLVDEHARESELRMIEIIRSRTPSEL